MLRVLHGKNCGQVRKVVCKNCEVSDAEWEWTMVPDRTKTFDFVKNWEVHGENNNWNADKLIEEA